MGGCVSSAEPPPPVAVQQPVAVDPDAQLLEAAQSGDVEKVRAALNGGANCNCKGVDGDGSGVVPLHCAIVEGHLECVRLLLERGADKDAKDKNGWTPLNYAAYYGKLECVRLLLERGADKDAKDNKGNTPLHKAAEAGHLECVRLLLERGADKEAKNSACALNNNNGKTPLDLIEDSWWDDADSRAAKEATRQLLRS